MDSNVTSDNDFLQDPAMIEEFLAEAEELLQGVDQDMVALESSPGDEELINRIFRAVHTIKGTAGFLAMEPVVRLSHRAEDVLNDLRGGKVRLDRRMMDVLLAARDQLGQMLMDIRQGGLKQYSIDELIAELEAVRLPSATPARLGDILVADGVLAPEALESMLQRQAESASAPKLGEMLVETGLATPAQVGDALVRQQTQSTQPATATDNQTMRVDVRKLDELINLVGELVLERNRLVRLAGDLGAGRVPIAELKSSFIDSTARLSSITEELQTAGLKTRMVTIDTVFRKFPRLVRDIAHSLKKDIELVVSGQDTEIDKTIVELIGDPLVHLVRNSLDHGLESPEVRIRANKPARGSIWLEARQQGDQILVSVIDDGAGIDPARVARKAVEKGLVTAERVRTLKPKEILDFVFLPGFSTAEVVNDLSGRGVGMDVVRTNLKKLNGAIELDSVLGKGTTILLRLPLTLAIMPVLMVGVADQVYALPLRSVVETAQVCNEDFHSVEGAEVLHMRGKTVPVIRMARVLARHDPSAHSSGDKVVIVAIGEARVALLVDRLLGQESTVIKPLHSYLKHTASFAGATISGDGRVRLVLDPAGLVAESQSLPA